MYILNMCVLQCILCASERNVFRIYGALQIKKYYYYYIAPPKPMGNRWTQVCLIMLFFIFIIII